MLHIGINSVILRALYGGRGYVAGENGVLRIVLKVSSRKGCAVDIHRRSIPSGNVHLICHLSDAVAEAIRKILVPRRGNNNAYGEADGAHTGKVIVDGCRSVTVVCADLADRLNRVSLIASERNKRVHLVQCQLIHKCIPCRVILINSAKRYKLDALICAGSDGSGVRILILSNRFGVQIVIHLNESRFALGAHLIGCRSCGGDGVVCKAVGAAEICNTAVCIIKLVCCRDGVALALVSLAVNNRGADSVGLGIKNGVGIGVY